MTVRTHPLSAEGWADLETIFEAMGCSIARACGCMFFRHSGKAAAPASGQTMRPVDDQPV